MHGGLLFMFCILKLCSRTTFTLLVLFFWVSVCTQKSCLIEFFFVEQIIKFDKVKIYK
ncbi:unnamed protein product, partial [Brassica napus]